MPQDPDSRLEAVRAACIDAALQAYEDAGLQGLCAEGRWEAAMAAIRRVDVKAAAEGTGPARRPPRPDVE
ncbi:MAG: acetyltransferase [Vicinamibacterales bacterium]